jgi:hypothetical protein
MLAGTVSTTVQGISCLHAVTNNAATAVSARGCKRMDRAFEAIEHMRLAAHLHFKAFIVGIATHFTCGCLAAKRVFTFIHVYLFSMSSYGERLALS